MSLIETIARKHFENKVKCKCGGDHVICLQCTICRASMPDQIKEPETPIESIIDATILRADATLDDVHKLCETAIKHKTASVCVNSYYIPYVAQILDSEVKTCTVINFPLGAGDAEAVAAEADAAIELGIDELDMVQSVAAVLNEDFEEAYDTIRLVAESCIKHNVLLKVILETCYLTDEQIILSSLYAKKAGADFVKTSTGFGSTGANAHVVKLMRDSVGPKLGVKASGGIKTKSMAEEVISAGANRLGASSVDALIG